MKTIRIGYQGDEGSNAEEAAHIFAKKLDAAADTWIEFIPLTTSERVFQALQAGKISLGVVAVRNSLGGIVSETRHMLDHAGIGGWEINVIDEHVLPIHHALFTRKPNTEIKSIASHEQALKQTKIYRAENYPDAREVETIDTAYAGEMLANGDFADEVAVLCRKDCGQKLGLNLVDENVEDDLSFTVFHLLQGQLAPAEAEVDVVEVEPEKTIADNPDTAEVLNSI